MLSIATAALDSRVTGIAVTHPALCDLSGPLHGRAGGWPRGGDRAGSRPAGDRVIRDVAKTFPEFAEQVGLDLEPFQKRIARALTSPREEVLILLPRGQGKTVLVAAFALWLEGRTEGETESPAASGASRGRAQRQRQALELQRQRSTRRPPTR